MWVDTRSDDGVAVAWQFFLCLLTSLFRTHMIVDDRLNNISESLSISLIICKNCILDPIKFWLVP